MQNDLEYTEHCLISWQAPLPSVAASITRLKMSGPVTSHELVALFVALLGFGNVLFQVLVVILYFSFKFIFEFRKNCYPNLG